MQLMQCTLCHYAMPLRSKTSFITTPSPRRHRTVTIPPYFAPALSSILKSLPTPSLA